ncbi:MAG: hypothetical protein K0S26_970, partial [Bacteroidota bacterium]|nr:hypothetical protein [Bacteroidota bacterium]
MIITEHITDFVSIELVNGILIGTLKCEYVDIAIARAAVKYRLKHFGDKDYLMIINMNNVKHITKEAREYLASEKGCRKIKCGAIIISSEVTKIIANFFIRINKPLVPTSLF